MSKNGRHDLDLIGLQHPGPQSAPILMTVTPWLFQNSEEALQTASAPAPHGKPGLAATAPAEAPEP